MLLDQLNVLRNIKIPKFITDEVWVNDQQILEFLNNKQLEFDEWFGTLINSKIQSTDSWLNYTFYKQGVGNEFGWHNEDGVGGSGEVMQGEYSSIIWIAGDTNCGGELSVISQDGLKTIFFEPGTVIVMPKTTFHKVEHYTGSVPRISLNFTFKLDT
jgi:hypothetical protein